MEEKKPIMPLPPKELRNMPPPPPGQTKNGAPYAEVRGALPSNTAQEENLQVDEAVIVSKKDKKKKEKKVDRQPMSSLALWLYWGGFALSIVGIGLCVFFLVK